jgi:pimeloyl-ACP methyl ester carboxylesterase
MYGLIWVLALVLVSLIVVLPIAGFLYQWLGAWHDRYLMADGELIDIGGRRHLYYVKKGERSPTVVFESGFAATSLNWMLIQDQISEQMQTVVYDRAGLGWSKGYASVRTPSKIAHELHLMLQKAGLEPPYVLVGHSFGGLVVRRFALDYPDEVVGVVLVDPMRTEEWPPVNERQRHILNRGIHLTRYAVWIARFGAARLAVRSMLCRSGTLSKCIGKISGTQGRHLISRLTSEVGKMPSAVRPGVAAHWSHPMFYLGLLAHLDALVESVEEMHDAEPIQGLPVIVLTPGSAAPLTDEALLCIGSDVRQVTAENSRHWVHLDEPELVIAAILELRSAAVQARQAIIA